MYMFWREGDALVRGSVLVHRVFRRSLRDKAHIKRTILNEQAFKLKLSSNEAYYTTCSFW